MMNQDERPNNLRFDEAKSFTENCKAFLSSFENSDAGMATVLLNNWDALVAITKDGDRNSRARSEFNSKVAAALDALVKKVQPKEGA